MQFEIYIVLEHPPRELPDGLPDIAKGHVFVFGTTEEAERRARTMIRDAWELLGPSDEEGDATPMPRDPEEARTILRQNPSWRELETFSELVTIPTDVLGQTIAASAVARLTHLISRRKSGRR